MAKLDAVFLNPKCPYKHSLCVCFQTVSEMLEALSVTVNTSLECVKHEEFIFIV